MVKYFTPKANNTLFHRTLDYNLYLVKPNSSLLKVWRYKGCGKSTQCKLLYDHLLSKNIKVILTREIGGVDSAEAIRNIVVNKELLPMSELMLVR